MVAAVSAVSQDAPSALGGAKINAFLSHLATKEVVSASTHKQALAALLFLYRTVLGGDLGNLEGVIRARKRQRPPVMLTVGEVRAVLHHFDGAEALVAQLLYGGGLRIMEALRLRIKDVDLEQRCITVRCGKGDKDRRTVLPSSLVDPLKLNMKKVQHQHQSDLSAGWGAVEWPHALERKYRNAAREWGWKWLFPQGRRWRDPRQNIEGGAPDPSGNVFNRLVEIQMGAMALGEALHGVNRFRGSFPFRGLAYGDSRPEP